MTPDVIVAPVSKQYPQGPPNFWEFSRLNVDGPKGHKKTRSIQGEDFSKLSS